MIFWYNIYEGRKETNMIEVKCEYYNDKTKLGKDYFVYTNIEVKGHAEHTGSVNNTKVCAGVSAICYGINRLINDLQYGYVCEKGYFHCWTERLHNLRANLDKDTVYALNTVVCQLYEIYCQYPNAFKSFELIDIKEKVENARKSNPNGKHNKQCYTRRGKRKMGLYSSIQSPYPQED